MSGTQAETDMEQAELAAYKIITDMKIDPERVTPTTVRYLIAIGWLTGYKAGVAWCREKL